MCPSVGFFELKAQAWDDMMGLDGENEREECLQNKDSENKTLNIAVASVCVNIRKFLSLVTELPDRDVESLFHSRVQTVSNLLET